MLGFADVERRLFAFEAGESGDAYRNQQRLIRALAAIRRGPNCRCGQRWGQSAIEQPFSRGKRAPGRTRTLNRPGRSTRIAECQGVTEIAETTGELLPEKSASFKVFQER